MRHHDVDAVSLVFGLLFTAVGLALLSGDPARGTMSLAWAGPVVAIGVGLLVVLAALPRREKAIDAQRQVDDQPQGIEE
jgi:cytochrome c-type biogenesis protein CcmH/NrfF